MVMEAIIRLWRLSIRTILSLHRQPECIRYLIRSTKSSILEEMEWGLIEILSLLAPSQCLL